MKLSGSKMNHYYTRMDELVMASITKFERHCLHADRALGVRSETSWPEDPKRCDSSLLRVLLWVAAIRSSEAQSPRAFTISKPFHFFRDLKTEAKRPKDSR